MSTEDEEPMNLTDEIMEMIYSNRGVINSNGAALIRSRLSAIEAELNELRGMASIARLGEITRALTTPPPYVRTFTTASAFGKISGFDNPAALPCCQMADWDGEDGG